MGVGARSEDQGAWGLTHGRIAGQAVVEPASGDRGEVQVVGRYAPDPPVRGALGVDHAGLRGQHNRLAAELEDVRALERGVALARVEQVARLGDVGQAGVVGPEPVDPAAAVGPEAPNWSWHPISMGTKWSMVHGGCQVAWS